MAAVRIPHSPPRPWTPTSADATPTSTAKEPEPEPEQRVPGAKAADGEVKVIQLDPTSRLYGSKLPPAAAMSRQANESATKRPRAHTDYQPAPDTDDRDGMLAPTPPRSPRGPAMHRFVAQSRSGGMDIGCVRVNRVLQDVEQRVRERERRGELQRSKWLRNRGRAEKASAGERSTDMRGGKSKRAVKIGRKKEREAQEAAAHPAFPVSASREEAGLELLMELLEACEHSKGRLGAAAGLTVAQAERADPVSLAQLLCARCQGLGELVLELTDAAVSGVLGLRSAQEEDDDEGGADGPYMLGPSKWGSGGLGGGSARTLPVATLGSHPFADEVMLDTIVEELLQTFSAAARGGGGSPSSARALRGSSRGMAESPLPLMDTIVLAQEKVRQDAANASANASGELRSGLTHWHSLDGSAAIDHAAMDTVAQVAPLLVKYGLTDFAQALKKYGFHKLPALRKASLEQLVQLGMSSTQANVLLRAAGGLSNADERSSMNRSRQSHIRNDAWFHQVAAPSTPPTPAVPRRRKPKRNDLASVPLSEAVKRHVANASAESPEPHPREPTEAEVAEAIRVRLEEEYHQSVKEKQQALRKERVEEQQAESWLHAQPARYRTKTAHGRAAALKLAEGLERSRELASESTSGSGVWAEDSHHSSIGGSTSQLGFGVANPASLASSVLGTGSRDSDGDLGATRTKVRARDVVSHPGDRRFLPTNNDHIAMPRYGGQEYVRRWEQLSSGRGSFSARVEPTWSPKTTSSFRVERVVDGPRAL